MGDEEDNEREANAAWSASPGYKAAVRETRALFNPRTVDAPLCHPADWSKTCACGRKYNGREYNALPKPVAGEFQPLPFDDGMRYLALRNCECKSTMATPWSEKLGLHADPAFYDEAARDDVETLTEPSASREREFDEREVWSSKARPEVPWGEE